MVFGRNLVRWMAQIGPIYTTNASSGDCVSISGQGDMDLQIKQLTARRGQFCKCYLGGQLQPLLKGEPQSADVNHCVIQFQYDGHQESLNEVGS